MIKSYVSTKTNFLNHFIVDEKKKNCIKCVHLGETCKLTNATRNKYAHHNMRAERCAHLCPERRLVPGISQQE